MRIRPAIAATPSLPGNICPSALESNRKCATRIPLATARRSAVGRKITVFKQLAWSQTRPGRLHSASGNRAPEDERDRPGAMVSALGAVDPSCAAEFGHHQNGCLRPSRTKRGFQRDQPSIELFKRSSQTIGLLGVRVPAADFQRRDARTIRRAQQFAGRSGQRRERIFVVGRFSGGDHSGAETTCPQTFCDRRTGDRIGLVQCRDRRIQVWRGLGETVRRPIRYNRLPTQQQRHRNTNGERLSPGPGGGRPGAMRRPARLSQPLVMRWSAPDSRQSCASK